MGSLLKNTVVLYHMHNWKRKCVAIDHFHYTWKMNKELIFIFDTLYCDLYYFLCEFHWKESNLMTSLKDSSVNISDK